jgi:hypothetical protein
MTPFIAKTKRLECPYELKRKLQLIKGSLVCLPLHRTQRHRTDHVSLHFQATSVIMPCAQSVVAHSPVLRQIWETISQLTSQWSKPPNIDACPHTIFIRPLVLSRKSTNLITLVLIPKPRSHHSDFEVQITKPSTLVLRPKLRNHHSGFEAKPLTTRHHQFWG